MKHRLLLGQPTGIDVIMRRIERTYTNETSIRMILDQTDCLPDNHVGICFGLANKMDTKKIVINFSHGFDEICCQTRILKVDLFQTRKPCFYNHL